MVHNEVSGLLKDSLRKYGSIWMRLEGKSMLPFLRSGTLISVRNAEMRDIHRGDIVIFKKDDVVIAHRVVKEINSNGRIFLRAKSDISFLSEPLIGDEALIGKVAAFKRFGAEIKIDNFVFRLLGSAAGVVFPFVAQIRRPFKPVTSYAVQD